MSHNKRTPLQTISMAVNAEIFTESEIAQIIKDQLARTGVKHVGQPLWRGAIQPPIKDKQIKD